MGQYAPTFQYLHNFTFIALRRDTSTTLDADQCMLMLPYLLKFLQVTYHCLIMYFRNQYNISYTCHLLQILPAGCELSACVEACKEVLSSENGQRALTIFCSRIYCTGEDYDYENETRFEGRLNLFDKAQWIRDPPLLCCWKKLASAVKMIDSTPSGSIDDVHLLCMGVLKFFLDGKRYAVS